jgi:Na+/H+ antiporter NhaD/arsenite permease-like protein
MLITNDVALITFVPFAIEVFGISGKKDKLALVVVLQTIAANLGSMLTPLGNPQNLYLYSLTGMGIGEFVLIMLPYTALSLLLLVACVFIGKDEKISFTMEESSVTLNRKLTSFYIILFVLCLLTVVRLIPWYITLAILVVAVLAADGRTLLKADYNLLLMFVCFFIFVGNMGKLDIIKDFLTGIIAGNECLVSVAASQVISNVPAALLLSGFTGDIEALILGTNLGGLGTLIASMASLISYKYIVKENKCSKGAYFGFFTVANVVF